MQGGSEIIKWWIENAATYTDGSPLSRTRALNVEREQSHYRGRGIELSLSPHNTTEVQNVRVQQLLRGQELVGRVRRCGSMQPTMH